VLCRLGAALRSLATERVWIAGWIKRRAIDRAASEVTSLDAQTLRDIGLTRGEALSAVLEAAGQIEPTRACVAVPQSRCTVPGHAQRDVMKGEVQIVDASY
jgi:uncharacterized protein YjiS (DUF1127 family)